MEADELEAGRGWNTWTELLLAAAALRHGQHSWDVVVSELRTRTRFPTLFTAELQVCKSKYKELQNRYSGSSCGVWFEELRKQCVAELKQQLATSEASIGLLESQIKYLEAEKHSPNHAWSQAGSPLDGSDPSSQNTSKDEHSAGSYTEVPRTGMSFSCKCHDQEMEIDTKPGLFSGSSEHDKDLGVQNLAEAGEEVIARRRRGCNQALTEGSVGESDNSGSFNCNQDRNSAMKNCNASAFTVKTNNLMEMFQCIAQSEPALVFKHRMVSQKQARYRKIIRQHVDIGMIRTRIISESIVSVNELFRDLLLLACNALVFYSRKSREYRSALSLRDLIMKEYKQQRMGSSHEATPASLQFNPPVRPRSARHRPCKGRLPQKCSNVDNIVSAGDSPNA